MYNYVMLQKKKIHVEHTFSVSFWSAMLIAGTWTSSFLEVAFSVQKNYRNKTTVTLLPLK